MKILFASHNNHKYQEIKMMLSPLVDVISLQSLGDTDDVEETGNSFEENSFIKAKYYYDKYHMSVFSDDSGLCVEALNNRPGIFSARFAGIHASDRDNCNLLLQELSGVASRNAFFICCICFINESGQVHYFQGKLTGKIANEYTKGNGFGYDPIFVISDGKRLSELTTEEKNKISHRRLAIEEFKAFLKEGEKNGRK